MKKVVTIQDISCVGKCSLTVALPIISALGIETAVIPTALLSTHTAFQGFFFHDLTSDITRIEDHWKKENFSFDAIYSGYLGSKEQVDIVSSFIDSFRKKDTLVVVDPAMADFGRMYAGFDRSFALCMASLCRNADVILPNMTEASFLLGEEPLDPKSGRYEIVSLIHRLSSLGAKKIVLKGIEKDDKTMGIAIYDGEKDDISYYFHEKVHETFHGTGDVFASVFTGAMVRGVSFSDAASLAADFTVEAIKETMKEENYHTYGVDFEKALPYLMKRSGIL